ncbi:STAS/SEC14 domain-containing protein [Owenweeksia hongkongensis]|uniref:STAS/SEC14 domain-containing protein n=1 Tax=Owenweeksia hongkongensis TaxID=253245 RepID=UPI003A90BC3A
MIKKIQFVEPDILGFEVDGRVSEAAFINMMQELIPKMESPGNIKLYVEIPRYEGTDWEVVWHSLKFAIGKLKTYFNKVDKIALVTDKGWLRFLATAEYKLIPAIDEKSFEFSEKEEALEWIRK